MRKAIFKEELEYYILVHKLSDGQRESVIGSLFENPIDVTKQYLLKKEHSSVDAIADCLSKLIPADGFIQDVRSLFEVVDDLELPPSLKEQLARKEPIAVFAGAGVSKILDIPLWTELARRAFEYLHKKGEITFYDQERYISESTTPKQKMSIFHDVCVKKDARPFYDECLNPIKPPTQKNPYDLLVKLDVPKFTSNLDHEFWDALERIHAGEQGEKKPKPVHVVSDFGAGTPILSNAIYQVHGSYRSLDKYSVVTMRDYLKEYAQGSNLHTFLNKAFSEYAFIFIGYGMEEFEILQDLIKSNRRKHHVLVGAYLNDRTILRAQREYFSGTLGMNVHGYYLDFDGYKRLYRVIDSWVEKILFEQNAIFYSKTDQAKDVEL